ncbi:hypothetical protein [Staphylococcus pseudintermedius]|nr:hypothetical protein [Staphylococcus pseudintermedius]
MEGKETEGIDVKELAMSEKQAGTNCCSNLITLMKNEFTLYTS